MRNKLFLFFISFSMSLNPLQAQQTEGHSIARAWNEILLTAIRNDFARPTVHARNLFHISAAMYDSWCLNTNKADTYFMGKNVGGHDIPIGTYTPNKPGIQAATETISYAVYRLLESRFRNSPDIQDTKRAMDSLMITLGYDIDNFDTDYRSGNPAALGNYIAEQIRLYGIQDGSNELGDYANLFYDPLNDALNLAEKGPLGLEFPNNWQPLAFGEPFIDQSGNVINEGEIDFLGPEWGNVVPFSLDGTDLNVSEKDDDTYKIYVDPGGPPLISDQIGGLDDLYKWSFAMVTVWGSHLAAGSNELIDISPNSIGNVAFEDLPTSFEAYKGFYDFFNGGDIGKGHDTNPITGESYEAQMVPLGDYGRVLAEFWADGPDSETPPGHWFVLLNHVHDHPDFVRRFKGEGEVLPPLEWDVKAYFLLGGTMHDAAISAWSVKGYYDYLRPISAIRYMGSQGQSSDPGLPSYDIHGIPLIPGFIELITEGDPLAGEDNENLDKIKLYSWKGHDFIEDAAKDTAGVGWILAENWWPYQRPSFVTPPFAGYVSGHSTFSRAAAELLTQLTGSEYFPGGIGEFVAKKNGYLVFEEGPSQDIVLQWARYYDASDQSSLSRIWGGIHPPVDDIPGRLMGSYIGKKAFAYGERYFENTVLSNREGITKMALPIYPNPFSKYVILPFKIRGKEDMSIFNSAGSQVPDNLYSINDTGPEVLLDLGNLRPGIYILYDGKGRKYKLVKK